MAFTTSVGLTLASDQSCCCWTLTQEIPTRKKWRFSFSRRTCRVSKGDFKSQNKDFCSYLHVSLPPTTFVSLQTKGMHNEGEVPK